MPEVLNKLGMTIESVARALCGVTRGTRIPTVSQLEEICSSSRGNIQKALASLKERGAISLEAHGQNGTLLTDIDYLAMARACGVSHITGAMPLPYTKRYEGLATALFTLLNTGEIRSFITFQRGSEARIQTLLDGSINYCVMSRLAYEEYAKRGLGISAVLDCGPLSYVGRHVLLTREGFAAGDWHRARVGIDQTSIDQSLLTECYFAGRGVTFVPVQYTHIVDMLYDGQLDAGIWNEDDHHVRVSDIPESELEGEAARQDNTHAVVVVRSNDALTYQLIVTLAQVNRVREIQQSVMNGEVPARY